MKAHITGSRDERIVSAIRKNLRFVDACLDELTDRAVTPDDPEPDQSETIELLTDAEGQLTAALSRVRFLCEQASKEVAHG